MTIRLAVLIKREAFLVAGGALKRISALCAENAPLSSEFRIAQEEIIIYLHSVQCATIYLHHVAFIDPFQKKIAERAAVLSYSELTMIIQRGGDNQ